MGNLGSPLWGADEVTKDGVISVAKAAKVTADEWPKMAKLEIDGELGGRRVSIGDLEKASEMAVQAFRSVLESKDYTVEIDAEVTYGYQAVKYRL